MPAPLSIYVVFHPDSDECRRLADHLHDWFRLKQDDGDGTEAGLPIWIRSRLEGTSKEAKLEPEIRFAEADVNVLIVLADDHFVADARWHRAIHAAVLAADEKNTRNLVLPVPVDWSAYRLAFLFGERNRLPAGDPARSNDPLKPDDKKGKARREARIAERARVLRRATTEAITRQLRKSDTDKPPKPLEVFLSHAKRDGTEIATALRDGLADYGQLKTWYDANELPPGYPWASPMEDAVHRQAAALISVVTDAYPTRPWCRREVNLARKPQRLKNLPEGVGDRVTAWTVQPSIGVTRGRETWSRPMAQLAQVPHLGWSEGNLRRIEDVVDRLLLETLLINFYRCYAPKVAARYAKEGDAKRKLALITWVPDPWSLAHLRGELFRQDSEAQWSIAYPGHGLRSIELQELKDLLEAMDENGSEGFGIKLINQERLMQDDPKLPHRMRIAYSAGGRHADLEPAGLSAKSMNDVTLRLNRRLLEVGCQLIYGGSLSNYADNQTQALIETAQGWNATQADNDSDDKDPEPSDLDDPPFVNYAAWPYSRFIKQRQRAELKGICDFLVVNPEEGKDPAVEAAKFESDNAEHVRMGADALTRMRELITKKSYMRIVLAGTIRNWKGWMPGIAEEIHCSLENNQLPLIIGGMGGCAGELARFLDEEEQDKAVWPASMTYEAATGDESFSTLIKAKGADDAARAKFESMKAAITTYRCQLHGPKKDWPFPVAQSIVKELLSTTGPAKAISLILKALAQFPPELARKL